MKVKIYRGTKEIGGNCIELTAENGKILWIDIGAPLNLDNPDISYATNKVDALLISHPHQDHYGLMENVDPSVPVYIGQVTLDLITATKIFLGKPLPTGNFKIFEPWDWITIARTFKVLPYLMDHSSPEAFAFLIDADNKRIFYSGDFRSTGWKGKLYYKLLKEPPPNIDLFLTEGTMVERSDQRYPTEESVQQAINAVVRDQQNVTFVVSSAQNIDRLVSVVKACNSNRKKLVVDVYNAWVLDMVKKKAPNLPTIDRDNICVYNHPSQLGKVAGAEFNDFRERIKKKDIGNRVFDNPEGYVYFLRCPNVKLVDVLLPNGNINLIYSQWKGYLEVGHKTYCADIIQELIDSKKVVFQHIHTSGHATLFDLKRLAKAVNPKKIVPIHTENPEKIKQEFIKSGFANVELWDDGTDYNI
jgi:ribonuclease J